MTNIEIVDELKALDLSCYPHNQIIELIRKIKEIGVLVYKVKAGTLITRARSGAGYRSKSALSYKPQEFNLKYQRASTPNRTMFYGTLIHKEQDFVDSRGLAISECSILARKGKESSGIERISFGKWIVTREFELISIIPLDEYTDVPNNPLLDEMRSKYRSFNERKDYNRYLEIMSFFSQEFCKTNIEEDYNYMISAIFSEVMIDDFGYGGILYPSVQMGGQLGFNFAIKPDIVDNCMELDLMAVSSYYKNKDKGLCTVDGLFKWNRLQRKFKPLPSRILSKKIISEKIDLDSLIELQRIN